MIEGIPGSGKSTLAKRVHEHLCSSGVKTTLYNEGSHNPLDLFWHAYLTREEFNQMSIKYDSMSKEINKHSIFENDYVLVPYKQLSYKSNESDLKKYLKEHEVCYSNKPLISLVNFKKVFLKRWYRFRESSLGRNDIKIFESVFFQHNIHDLLRLYAPENKEIIEYLYSLIHEVIDFKPILIYLTQSSVEETLTRVWKERNKDNNCFKFIENSKWKN